MSFTQDFRTQRRNYNDGETRIGEKDRLWYDANTNTIRISDGETPGGVVVGGSGGGGDYTLPTATTTVKGGVKVDGTTITINNQIISATQPDLSIYATQSYVTSRGYLTSVGTISYNDLSNKPTLFSGSYTDLSDKPTIPSLTGYATETYVTTRGYISSYTETDPVFLAHAANNVTNTKISNWDTAYGWGNHASAGYLTSVGTISYNDLSNKPTLFSGSYTDLTNKPTLFDGAYASLTGKPTLFSGSYTDLTNKPTIPTTVTVNGTAITLGSSGTVTAAAGTLTGSTLASGVTASSLTSVGTLTSLTVNSTNSTAVSITADGRPGSETNNWSFVSNQSIGGPRAWIQFPDSTLQTTAYTGSAPVLTTARNINGVSFNGSADITVTADANTLTGTTLKSTVVSSSLTSVGTLTSLTSSGLVRFNSDGVGASYNAVSNSVNIGGVLGVASNIYTNGNIDIVAGSAYYIGGNNVLNGTTLGSNIVNSSLTSVGTLTSLTSTGSVTANHTTAFIAGDNAISNVALQIPREGAIRNLYNGAANNMYFDVSIGGTSQGQFQFRSSSAYTNILTMSPTAFTVNTDAVVTARTPSFGRTAWNAAIDTEITIDEYRFRVTNSGGIYPQIISNVSGQTKNSAWTAVAAISGQAIGQGGSTGTLVPNNAWTNLYTFAAMNAAGDTVTVTLQDKAQGRIYRVTFMRSDNGSTTGYNIIAERLL